MHTTFEIQTSGAGLYEFTHAPARWINGQGNGLLTLLVQHTSASLLVQKNSDPKVQTDLQAFFSRLVPPTSDPSMFLAHAYI